MQKESQTPFKQISAIVLLFLFSYNVVLCHVSLWLWKVYMNEQIEELANVLPNESLEEIILPFTETPENEINYNGVMYDVIRFEQNGPSIKYFCVKDFTENILSLEVDEDLSNVSISAKKQWSGHSKQLQKNTSLKYTRASNLMPKLALLTCEQPYVLNSESTHKTILVVHSPPPDQELI